LLRDLRVLVDVHLDQADLALGIRDRAFQQGRELLARPAPGRPEINDNRLVARRLDDVVDEVLGVAVPISAPPIRRGAGPSVPIANPCRPVLHDVTARIRMR
jgi:hypothetical protein